MFLPIVLHSDLANWHIKSVARCSGREPSWASKIVATSPMATVGSFPISTMLWLADTDATIGIPRVPLR